MLVGAALSQYLTPETSDIHGKSRSLQDLAQGKLHRKDMERQEQDSEDAERKQQ